MSEEEKNDDSSQLFNNSSSKLVTVDGVDGLVTSDNPHALVEKTSVETGLIETQNMQNESDRTSFDQSSKTDEVMKQESENGNIRTEADDRSSVASLKQSDSCKTVDNLDDRKEAVTESIENENSSSIYDTEQHSSTENAIKQEDENRNNDISKPGSDRSSSSVLLKHSDSEKNGSMNEKENVLSAEQGTSHHNNQDNPPSDQTSSEDRSEGNLVNENINSGDDNSNGVSFTLSDLDNNDDETNREKDVVTTSREEQTSNFNKHDITDQPNVSGETTKQELTDIIQNEIPQPVVDNSTKLSTQSALDNKGADGVKNDENVENYSQRAPDVETGDSLPLSTDLVPGTESASAVKSEPESKTDREPANEVSSSDAVDPKSENPDDQKEESSKTDSNSNEQIPTITLNRSNKPVVENRTVARLRSPRERKGSASREAARKVSTPRNSTTKKEEHKPSISKDTKKPFPTRKFGVDHSKERPNQIAPNKDTNIHKPSITNKSLTVDNQGAENFKESQLSEKDVEKKQENLKSEHGNGNRDVEKKQQLKQSRKNSASEMSSSAQEHDNNETKESGKQGTKDQNVKPGTTYTVVNEKEERKKSPKVKWNEKTLQPKALPNGDIKSNENNQEKDQELKTETAKENERNLSNSVEKGKSVAIIEEGGENINDKDKEAFNPKSILAKAVWKKGGKDKSGAGFVAMNGPAKSHSKASLAVRSISIADEKDDKVSMESRRDSTMLSLDSLSHKSVDFRNTNMTTNTIPEEKPRSLLHNNNDSWIRSAIPYQPLSLSILCLFLNIFLPGTGTVLSGFSILCCGKTRVASKDDHVTVTVCVNIWVGVAQLFTITFCLVGWFWSIVWGIKMVILSVEYRRELRAKREMELQAMALSAFGSPTRVRQLFNTTA